MIAGDPRILYTTVLQILLRFKINKDLLRNAVDLALGSENWMSCHIWNIYSRA